TTAPYTLSLHAALPISAVPVQHLRHHQVMPEGRDQGNDDGGEIAVQHHRRVGVGPEVLVGHFAGGMVVGMTGEIEHGPGAHPLRSEEHTSELQSRENLV